MQLFLSVLSLHVALTSANVDVPVLPKEYSAVILMKMPYFGLEMPLRVLTSAQAQKIEYYNGLQVDVSNSNGTWKFVFANGDRSCLYTEPSSGPKGGKQVGALQSSVWEATAFFPDLSTYTSSGQELIGGIMCQKFTLGEHHGATGTMDDHISFYWDPVLGKPVRWRMHSRHKVFNSHTDEYVMDYLSFDAAAPLEAGLELPESCKTPVPATVSIHIGSFLKAALASRVPHAEEAGPLFFDAYLRAYGKSYPADEHTRRRLIFEKNVELVQKLNQKHAGTARFRGNYFLDMTREEVMRFRGGKRLGKHRRQQRSVEDQAFVRNHELAARSEPLPKSFDWREAIPGVVGPVKDQAMCGSCWTYGLTEPIESIRAIQSGRPLVLLPEQFVVDCTWKNATDESGGNQGCDGGNADLGALEIVRKFGGVIPSAQAYGSYLSVNGYCKDTRLMDVGAKITGWVDIKARQELSVLDALVNKGPLSVSIMVPDEMLFYDSGVLKVESCKYNETLIDHSVVVTGFGTDHQGTDYYTIRNSWSTYWGDQGYIKVARGDLDCCVSSEAGYPLVAAEAEGRSDLVI